MVYNGGRGSPPRWLEPLPSRSLPQPSLPQRTYRTSTPLPRAHTRSYTSCAFSSTSMRGCLATPQPQVISRKSETSRSIVHRHGSVAEASPRIGSRVPEATLPP